MCGTSGYLLHFPSLKRLFYGRLFFCVKILITALLLGVLLVILNPLRLWNNLFDIDPFLIGMALLLGVVGVLVQWIKWQHLLQFYYPEITWSEGLKSLLIGFALGLVSPGRLGELGRGLFLEGDRAALVGLAAADRCSSFVVTLAAAWVGFLVLFPTAALCLFIAAIGLGALAYWAGKRVGRSLHQWAYTGRIWKVFKDIPPGLWGKVLAWSIVFNFTFFLQFYILLNNWGKPPLEGIWGIPVIFGLKALLPLSFLDLGVREGAAVLVYSQIGIDPAPAFNAAFLLFVINVFLPSSMGLALIQRHWGLWRGMHQGKKRYISL